MVRATAERACGSGCGATAPDYVTNCRRTENDRWYSDHRSTRLHEADYLNWQEVTKQEAIAAARSFCESPAGIVRVRPDEAWFVEPGSRGISAYTAPDPPYWVVPISIAGLSRVGASSAVIVGDGVSPQLVTYGE